jgi:DNA-binding NtrC family response regulator
MEPTVLGAPQPIARGGRITVVGHRGASIDVGTAPCVVGRDPSCQLVLDDRRVSSTHLELAATEHGLHVRDLGSSNGTFLGEHRIVEALLSKPARIQCGDTILDYRPGKPHRVPLSASDVFGPLVGGTPQMRALFAQMKRLARTDLSVLICGETGTGKELAAQAIHEASGRAGKPFAVIDCSSIPTQLAESVLFGHERGAFSGAVSRGASPFVEASGGTVFLDELGELPLDVQPKLLRALAEQKIKAVGSTRYLAFDVRVIAATWRDLPREINRGGFRSDLFFRIADERVELPALRQRLDDIPLLTQRMMVDLDKGSAFDRVTPESLDRLTRHGWPGNVRELRSLVRRALSYDDGGAIDLAQYLSPVDATNGGGTAAGVDAKSSYDESKEAHDSAYFRALFESTGGNVSEMSRRAGVNRETVRSHLRRHRIEGGGGPSRR